MEKKSNKTIIISMVIILIVAIIITAVIAMNINSEEVLEENRMKEVNEIIEPSEGEDIPQETITTPQG